MKAIQTLIVLHQFVTQDGTVGLLCLTVCLRHKFHRVPNWQQMSHWWWWCCRHAQDIINGSENLYLLCVMQSPHKVNKVLLEVFITHTTRDGTRCCVNHSNEEGTKHFHGNRIIIIGFLIFFV